MGMAARPRLPGCPADGDSEAPFLTFPLLFSLLGVMALIWTGELSGCLPAGQDMNPSLQKPRPPGNSLLRLIPPETPCLSSCKKRSSSTASCFEGPVKI